MGWNFTLIAFNRAEADLVRRLGFEPDAALQVHALLDRAVPPSRRDPEVVARLNETDDLREWLAVAFAETAIAERAFLGRSVWVSDYAKAVTKVYGRSTSADALARALEGLSRPVDELVPLYESEMGVLVIAPEDVGRLGALVEQVSAEIAPTSADDIAAAFEAMKGNENTDEFVARALPLYLGFVLAAGAAGHGLAMASTRFERLTSGEPATDDDEVALLVPNLRPLQRSDASTYESRVGTGEPATLRPGWPKQVGLVVAAVAAIAIVIDGARFPKLTSDGGFAFLALWAGVSLAQKGRSAVTAVGGGLLIAVVALLVSFGVGRLLAGM